MNGQSMTYPQSQQPQQSHQQLQQQIQQLQQQLQQTTTVWTAGSTPDLDLRSRQYCAAGNEQGYPQVSAMNRPLRTDGSDTTGSGQVLQTPARFARCRSPRRQLSTDLLTKQSPAAASVAKEHHRSPPGFGPANE